MSTPEVLSLLHEQSIPEDAEPGEDSATVHEAELGGVQKNMRMYRCTVDGCHKAFVRGEHLKRHVRSIHMNEKREYHLFCNHSSSHDFLQRTSVLWKDAESNSTATITLGCTCVCTKAQDIPWLATAERVHDSSMPALRPVTFTFYFSDPYPLAYTTLLLSSRLAHVLLSQFPSLHQNPTALAVSIHVYSIFYFL